MNFSIYRFYALCSYAWRKYVFMLAVLLCALSVSAQTGSIKITNVEHDCFVNGQKGMKIHSYVNVAGWKGKEVQYIVFFYNKDNGAGGKLYSTGEYTAVDGHVCVSGKSTASYPDSEWKDWWVFIPHSAFPYKAGKNYYSMKAQVRTTKENGSRSIASSAYYNFTLTSGEDRNPNNNQNSNLNQNKKPTDNTYKQVNNNTQNRGNGKAEITSISFTGDKYDPQKSCNMKISVSGEVSNLQGQPCMVSVYFYNQAKQAIRATSSSPKTSDGQLAVTSQTFYPAGNRNTFSTSVSVSLHDIVACLRGSNVEEFNIKVIVWCNNQNCGEKWMDGRARFAYGFNECSYCHGKGMNPCVICSGTGQRAVPVFDFNNPYSVGTRYEACYNCKGKQYFTCGLCNGGKISYSSLTAVGRTNNSGSYSGGNSGGGGVVIINSGGGSNSNNWNNEPSRPIPCSSCGQTGRCRTCNGTGLHWATDTGNCKTCLGTGRCPGCNGTGHY